ncbi:hypothetical protein FSP39_001829 [Pinctada imbricata]|uniref:Uncharacterized protein n=1 Tax=Pinctada imbricata TaxID=66713 RepID=A0AA88Y0Z2_PINIB|nr:hypothetical protein FSP39_001829 [Pinctada imbricata]
MATADVVRSFEIPDAIPPGNWLAHKLRLVNMQSEGLLPESRGSRRSYEKYNTVTHKDYIPPQDGFMPEEPDLNQEPFQKKRETVADIMLAPHPRQLFLNWNVPNRYIPGSEDGKVEHYDPPLLLKSDEDAKLETINEEGHEIKVSPVPSKASSVKAPSPIKSARSHKSPAPEMIQRQMSLPELRLRSSDNKRPGLTREYTKLPDMSGSPAPAVPTLARSKTELQPSPVVPSPRRSVSNLEAADIRPGLREELQQSLQPQVVDKAEQWMKLAPNADRKVIERVLKMAEKKQKQNVNLTRALQPNAKEAVEKWLTDANDDERQVALRFFNSVAGEKLMGMSHTEQKKRLQQVIHALENGKGVGVYSDPNKFKVRRSLGEPRSSYKFNHLRLLSPDTRRDRWMHTTWHHLPEYKTNNIVENKSSHYTQPQALIPRHFVIHPDWG